MSKPSISSLILMVLLSLLPVWGNALLDSYLEGAKAAQKAGETTKAESLYEAAWTEAQKLPADDERGMQTLDAVRKFYQEQKNFAKIDEILLKALEQRKATLDKKPKDAAYLASALGYNAMNQGHLDKAEAYYTLLVEIGEKHFYGHYKREADALDNLAEVQEKLGKQPQADALRARVAKLRQFADCDEDPKRFRSFIFAMQKTIKSNWKPPVRDDLGNHRTTARFFVRQDGSIVNVRFSESAGKDAEDAATQALKISSPLKGMPKIHCGEDIPVQFIFDYDVKSR